MCSTLMMQEGYANINETKRVRRSKTYFKKKWRKEHISLFVIIGLILIAALIIPFVIHKPWLIGLLPILAVVEHCYQYNKMMIYVENNLYH